MTGPRDTLSVKLAAARKRREAALQRVAAEEATIQDLLARKREAHTRALRRTAHWTKRQSREAREIHMLLSEEGVL